MGSIIIHPAAAMRRGETLDDVRWTAEQRRIAILQLSEALDAERARRLEAERAARRYALLAFAAGGCTFALGAACAWLLAFWSWPAPGCSTAERDDALPR
jgi:hypothetical protein